MKDRKHIKQKERGKTEIEVGRRKKTKEEEGGERGKKGRAAKMITGLYKSFSCSVTLQF